MNKRKRVVLFLRRLLWGLRARGEDRAGLIMG